MNLPSKSRFSLTKQYSGRQQQVKIRQLNPKSGVTTAASESIFIKEALGYQKIALADILYIETFRNYLEIQFVNERRIIRSTLKDFSQILPPQQFVQTHRSYVVNLEKVEKIGGNFLLVGGKEVPVSRSQRSSILQRVRYFS